MKKKAMCTILSAAMFAGLAVQPVSAEASLLGDVNTDGQITISDVIMLSRYVAEDTSLPLDDAALANADANYDGIVTAADCTSILRAIAGLEPLSDVPVNIDCLRTYISQTYLFDAANMTEFYSLQSAVQDMHIVTTMEEHQALLDKGYPYYGGPREQDLETGVAMLATTVEQSENVTLSLREVFKYQGQFVFLVDRTKPQGEDEGPLAHFNLTFIIDKDDYNGESAVVYYTDMITVGDVLCESHPAGEKPYDIDDPPALPSYFWINSYDELCAYTAECDTVTPLMLQYDENFFTDNCLLIGSFRDTIWEYPNQTNALIVAEDGTLQWQINYIRKYFYGVTVPQTDLLALTLPKSYANSDVTFKITTVNWIP